MPTALIPFLLSLALLIVPLTSHAGDANDFVAANPAKQAKLLESWAAHPDPARQPLLDALQQGRVGVDASKTAFYEVDGSWQAAETAVAADGTPKKLRLNNRLRGLLANAQASQQLLATEPATRLAAAQQLQKSAKPAQLELLNARVAGEQDDSVRAALALAEEGPSETGEFEQRLAKDANDHEARYEIAKALAARGAWAEASDHLLTIIAADRAWNDEAARKQLLTIFEAAGSGSDITRAGRRRLSSILFS